MHSPSHTNYGLLYLWWKSVDQRIILTLALIFACSAALVTTASPPVASRIGLDEFYFVRKHLMYLAGATVVIFVLSCLNHKWIKRIAIVGFFVSLVVVFMVQFYGHEVKGAKRWITIAGLSLQPSEFMKPCFAVVTAWLISLKQEFECPSISIILVLYFIVAIALIIQPDFGMLIMISSVLGVQLFVAGIPLLWIIVILLSAGTCVVVAYTSIPHVTQRINSFLYPSSTENYQVAKSLTAFEHGGFYGTGPGEGVVKQVIPDCHADFIFAVAGEEFGVIICVAIAMLFAFIVFRSLLYLLHEENQYIFLSVVGIATQFGLQALINMGVTLNLLPTKGMTLPFISYGGSSTIAIALSIGMLLSLTKKHINVHKYKLQIIS